MTEQQYINVKELGTVTAAINVLSDITPANSEVIKIIQKSWNNFINGRKVYFKKLK